MKYRLLLHSFRLLMAGLPLLFLPCCGELKQLKNDVQKTRIEVEYLQATLLERSDDRQPGSTNLGPLQSEIAKVKAATLRADLLEKEWEEVESQLKPMEEEMAKAEKQIAELSTHNAAYRRKFVR
jgi:DNA repair exonuclease SbcCD ATPase subunit